MEAKILKEKKNIGRQSVGAGHAGSSVGLRERQKADRRRRIMAGAEVLFGTEGFEATTMAAIADHAGVSRPTVFNYFRSKDELLLAIVFEVHRKTQAQVRSFQLDPAASLAEAICSFLRVYTQTSLDFIDRRTWCHVEATCIRMPDSDFVQQYDQLTDEMLQDFRDFINKLVGETVAARCLQSEPMVDIMFNHWSALFIQLIRDQSTTVDEHIARLRKDLSVLITALAVEPADRYRASDCVPPQAGT